MCQITGIRGVSRHNEAGVSFVARQVLDMAAPSNLPLLNPEVIETTIKEQGANVLRGAAYYIDTLRRFDEKAAGAGLHIALGALARSSV